MDGRSRDGNTIGRRRATCTARPGLPRPARVRLGPPESVFSGSAARRPSRSASGCKSARCEIRLSTGRILGARRPPPTIRLRTAGDRNRFKWPCSAGRRRTRRRRLRCFVLPPRSTVDVVHIREAMFVYSCVQLSAQRNETETKQRQNCFKTVLKLFRNSFETALKLFCSSFISLCGQLSISSMLGVAYVVCLLCCICVLVSYINMRMLIAFVFLRMR